VRFFLLRPDGLPCVLIGVLPDLLTLLLYLYYGSTIV